MGLLEGRLGLIDRVIHSEDPVETWGAQDPHEAGPVADHDHVAAQLTGSADPPDEGTEAGGVDKRHPAHVDHQARPIGQLGQRLTELADREGVELPDGASVLPIGRSAQSWVGLAGCAVRLWPPGRVSRWQTV